MVDPPLYIIDKRISINPAIVNKRIKRINPCLLTGSMTKSGINERGER